MICPRCHLGYEGTAHNCPAVLPGGFYFITVEEYASLRAERDRYARALRRAARAHVRRQYLRYSGEDKGIDIGMKLFDLRAREARGSWRDSWGG